MKFINEFTLHDKYGDYMAFKSRSLEETINECNKQDYDAKVIQTYYDKSAWKPWSNKLVKHGKEVYRNY